jgi:7-cyano-7-deazaguanine tRNA-ribosyltransferase
MKIVLGLQDSKIPIWQFGTPLMINQLNWDNIFWDNETWVDSGGFQILNRGAKISLDQVIRKYDILNAHYYISLDIPPPPCSKPSDLNFKHFEYLYSKLEKKVIPVIHAYDIDSIKKAVDFYSQYTDIVAFGGVVLPSLNRGGGKRLPLVIYKLLRKEWKGKIHVLGAGSPFMRKLYYDAYSVDTSTYRVKAIHGMVMIPGKGERYVGERKIAWRVKRATEEELETLMSFLEKTHFPFPIRLNDWIGRSLINAWVTLNSEYEKPHYLIEYSKNIKDPEEEIRKICYSL